MLIDFSKLVNNGIKKPTYKKKKSAKNIINKDTNKLTSKDISHALGYLFLEHKYVINNAYIFDWESDFFSVSDSGYVYEVEIKVTRGDFKDDFNKTAKHTLLESLDPIINLKRPNKFFYAAPKGLLTTIEIPKYAGLIEVDNTGEIPKIVKNAPFLHRENSLSLLKDKLLDKFYYRYREFYLKEENNPVKTTKK
jgi:hypothetical protein